jgi:O-methyltransferase
VRRAYPKLPPPLIARGVFALTNWLSAIRRKLIPPPLAAIELATSSWAAMAIAAFTELKIADVLADGAQTAQQLAASLQLNPSSLYRLLRSLTGYDIVREDAGGTFSLTPIGRSLASTAVWSASGMVRYANAGWHAAAWTRLADGVRSGKVPFEIAHGQSFFEYCVQQPDAGALFDEAMHSVGAVHVAAVLGVYDFGHIRHLIDVGGGTGFLLAAILQRYPSMRGTLFEMPTVLERARKAMKDAGVGDRCSIAGGDFFQTAPAGGDAYLVSHVLHDWDDADATQILRAIASAMPADGRVLIVEIVMDPPNRRWTQGKLSDLQMLTALRGRERTRAEFAALLQGAGLRIARIVPTAAAESIIEAQRAAPLK